ncbi:MAG: aspartate kinase [Anaerolineae bacterium]|jgi:aspartokinase/homoserine dehydrogenase 1
MIVHKFGGTSLGNAERFGHVADLVTSSPDPQRLVVVSAMSGTTNALINAARDAAAGSAETYIIARQQLADKHLTCLEQLLPPGPERDHLADEINARLDDMERLCFAVATLGELTPRGHDAVASIGEELSSRLLAALFRARGIAAEQVSATELIVTDDHHGEARPDLAATRSRVRSRLAPLLEQGVIPVVTGYIGATPTGVTTTLGRGGSDYSAALLGVSLNAREVWVWSDVDGILTADPKLVPGAHRLPELSYAEAEELAYFGADVLHPKTVKPLAQAGVPLRILNSLNPTQAGTLISARPSADRPMLPAIVTTEELSLIQVLGNGAGWTLTMASRALAALAQGSAEVFMFSQSFSERSLNLVVRSRDHGHSVHLLKTEFQRELSEANIAGISAEVEVAALSVVGTPDAQGTPITQRAFAALSKLGLRVIAVAQAASAYSVSFIIPERDIAAAVPFLHRELGL